MEQNVDTIRKGNAKTLEIQTEQFTDMQKRWESEKEEVAKAQADAKKLKCTITELEESLATAKTRAESGGKLSEALDTVKNSTEAADKIAQEVGKAKEGLAVEKKLLRIKLGQWRKLCVVWN